VDELLMGRDAFNIAGTWLYKGLCDWPMLYPLTLMDSLTNCRCSILRHDTPTTVIVVPH